MNQRSSGVTTTGPRWVCVACTERSRLPLGSYAQRASTAQPAKLNTVRLVEAAPGTTIIATIRYPSPHAREAALATQMRVGLSESLHRLSRHLHVTSKPAGPTGSASTQEHHDRE